MVPNMYLLLPQIFFLWHRPHPPFPSADKIIVDVPDNALYHCWLLDNICAILQLAAAAVRNHIVGLLLLVSLFLSTFDSVVRVLEDQLVISMLVFP